MNNAKLKQEHSDSEESFKVQYQFNDKLVFCMLSSTMTFFVKQPIKQMKCTVIYFLLIFKGDPLMLSLSAKMCDLLPFSTAGF